MKTEETDLTLVDLQNLRTILDIAARRGAFAAAEMASVGQIFVKLDAFINNNSNENAEVEKVEETSE